MRIDAAIHVERAQVERFALKLQQTRDVVVLAVSSPLVFIAYCELKPTSEEPPNNQSLKVLLDGELRKGRFAAQRVYSVQDCCGEIEWIPRSSILQAIKCTSRPVPNTSVLKVVGYPRLLQTKMTQILQADGYHIHPKKYTHELHIFMEPSVSPYFHFGVVVTPTNSHSNPVSKTTMPSTVPSRAYYKMEESLPSLSVQEGEWAMDIGASPGGWTQCLALHGTNVVAIDPGKLYISPDLYQSSVVHYPMLFEEAKELIKSDYGRRFSLCVCDINVRVDIMADLITQAAPLLLPDARLVLTLKLGKKPTSTAIAQAVSKVTSILSQDFTSFHTKWLHANTQNERTLFASKRPQL